MSGRDPTSVERLVSILSTGVHPAVRPGDVWLVKDPVLSDKALTDTTGACWGQSSGAYVCAGCGLPPNRATSCGNGGRGGTILHTSFILLPLPAAFD